MKTDYELDELALDAEIQEGEHTGSKAKDVFCKQWANARTGLTTLQLLLSRKIVMSFVIGVIITVSDKIKEKFCPKEIDIKA